MSYDIISSVLIVILCLWIWVLMAENQSLKKSQKPQGGQGGSAYVRGEGSIAIGGSGGEYNPDCVENMRNNQ